MTSHYECEEDIYAAWLSEMGHSLSEDPAQPVVAIKLFRPLANWITPGARC